MAKSNSRRKIVNELDNSEHQIDTITKPFVLMERDPKQSNRGKSKKVLTKQKRWSIIELVNKAKRKDDKMASDKNKKLSKGNALKSVAWLVEATFRTFVGWILLTNFDHLVTTAAAFYALGTAALIVVAHFVTAHK